MKILMINVVCGIRSTGRICTDLATALEAQGHEVKIAYGREKVPEQFEKYAVRIGNNLDVKIHGLVARLFDGMGFGSRKATDSFIKWVELYNPDVIHLHNLHGYYINVEILFDYLKKCGKKIIWTLHDCWSFTGHTAYCDSVSCVRWKDACHECPLIKAYPSSFFDKSEINWKRKKMLFTGIPNLTIVTPSNWLKKSVEESFLKEYSVKIINNGIDVSKFYPIESDFRKKYGLEGKYLILGVSTSWDEMKGYSDYLTLANLLGDNYTVLLVGLTKRQIKELPDNVIGIERTTSIRELSEIYTAADLLVNLTYCDNYPTVNLEAMSCGTSVLTYNTGGSPETVEKYGGIIVPRGDIERVAQKCVEYLQCGIKKDLRIDKNECSNERVISEYLKIMKM